MGIITLLYLIRISKKMGFGTSGVSPVGGASNKAVKDTSQSLWLKKEYYFA